jgi:putative phosphoesterase
MPTLPKVVPARVANIRDHMRDGDLLVGVISDTHGLMRPQAIAALAGADLIIHAGDVGRPEVIERLGSLAPTSVVRGNIDTDKWAARLPLTASVTAGSVRFFVLHEIAQLDFDPGAAGFAAVVFGHSHRPSIEMRGEVLFLNPGSAGPRRFKLPVTVARVRVSGRQLHPDIVELPV